MLTHDDNRQQFVCNVPKCGKTYVLEQSLQKHMRDVHDEEGPEPGKKQKSVVCEQCGKCFTSIGSLKVKLTYKPKNIT